MLERLRAGSRSHRAGVEAAAGYPEGQLRVLMREAPRTTVLSVEATAWVEEEAREDLQSPGEVGAWLHSRAGQTCSGG